MTKHSRIVIDIDSNIRPITISDMGEFQDATEFVEGKLHDAIADAIHRLCIEDDDDNITDHVATKLLDDADVKIDRLGDLGEVQLRFSFAEMKVTHDMRKFTGKPRKKSKK